MAVMGIGPEYDVSMKLGPELRTTTAQYAVVGMPNTSTAVDFTVYLSGATATTEAAVNSASPTCTAFKAIGILQTKPSATCLVGQVRLFGLSKVVCAESITSGNAVMAYWGISTTTMAGRIVNVDDGVTISVAGASVSAQCVILGRALEDGSTGTVITMMVNPQLYDLSLVGTIGIT